MHACTVGARAATLLWLACPGGRAAANPDDGGWRSKSERDRSHISHEETESVPLSGDPENPEVGVSESEKIVPHVAVEDTYTQWVDFEAGVLLGLSKTSPGQLDKKNPAALATASSSDRPRNVTAEVRKAARNLFMASQPTGLLKLGDGEVAWIMKMLYQPDGARKVVEGYLKRVDLGLDHTAEIMSFLATQDWENSMKKLYPPFTPENIADRIFHMFDPERKKGISAMDLAHYRVKAHTSDAGPISVCAELITKNGANGVGGEVLTLLIKRGFTKKVKEELPGFTIDEVVHLLDNRYTTRGISLLPLSLRDCFSQFMHEELSDKHGWELSVWFAMLHLDAKVDFRIVLKRLDEMGTRERAYKVMPRMTLADARQRVLRLIDRDAVSKMTPEEYQDLARKARQMSPNAMAAQEMAAHCAESFSEDVVALLPKDWDEQIQQIYLHKRPGRPLPMLRGLGKAAKNLDKVTAEEVVFHIYADTTVESLRKWSFLDQMKLQAALYRPNTVKLIASTFCLVYGAPLSRVGKIQDLLEERDFRQTISNNMKAIGMKGSFEEELAENEL